MNNYLLKQMKFQISMVMLILSSCYYLNAQTFTGSIINTAGNSLIPSTGTGGCTVAPQTTGGTIFNNVVTGLSGNCVRLSSIQINLTHTWDDDLDIFLRSPTGQILELVTDWGGSANNFTNTIFCDTSCTVITSGAAPFTGIFKPEGTLTATACGTTITPNVQALNAFTATNGTWELVIKDDVGGDVGVMLAWSLNFENIADIESPVGTTILPMAPGTCTPLGGVACLSPNITSCARTNNGIFYSLSLPANRFNKCLYTRCNGTVNFPGAGMYTIYWLSLNGCAVDTASQRITVLDNEPPTIMGCPKAVNINLGPGECQAAWDAPPFMAMDNCPFSGPLTTSQGCNLGANNFLTAPGFLVGLMFSVQNASAQLMKVKGLSFMPDNVFGDMYRVYASNVNSGYLPIANNPAAWVLVGNDMQKIGQTTFPPPIPRLLTQFNLNTVVDIPPGETRGFAIYGSAPAVTQYYVNGAAPCTTMLQGDANCKIDVRDGRVQYGTAYFQVSGTFSIRMFNGNIDYSLGQDIIPLVQTCGQPYGPGSYFPIGCKTLCYEATDAAGNKTTCQFDVCVIPYANTVTALACHDEIQISLDENCSATIGADEVLAGGPYRCYDDYNVEARDWITNAIIDRQPNVPGVQVSSQDIGRQLKLTVRDPRTGNSCWGHATVEDKLPPTIVCRDTCVPCYSSITPFYTGTPVVRENCSSYTLTYYDDDTQGSCALGYDRVIIRVWTATDPYGNRARCNQRIQVSLGTLADVAVPASRDNVDAPMLNCNEKIYDKDVTPHYLSYPYCVDGYLLDSAHWFATGGFLPSPNGDLAGERLPRILGWNCLDSGPFTGHPNPFPVYYPAHPSWRANNPVCWGPDEVVMWEGTGYPGNAYCRNLGINYNDITIDLRTPGCDAGPIGCFKIIRQWTVADWCTGLIGGHNQIIKVGDGFGPEILYPDTVNVNMEVWTCTGRWEVPPAWLRDNCSNEIHYSVRVDDGTVLGDEDNGYVVINMPVGVQNGYIVATDCCGNQTKKRIALNVFDNVPPIAVCEQKTIVSINGNQSPGENFAKVFAESFDQGSFDNCQPHIFFKVIRMEHLRGTNNGSNANQADNGTNCSGINGDDNPLLDGNQIYFDDHVKFCCSDVGKTVMVVFRVYDREPGLGPIPPARMNPGGVLFNRFSDCMVEVEVQDKSVPTVVPPPNIVVSCWFWFDVDKIDDPNDPTFGRVVTDLSDRHKVVTNDLVCYNYCVRNDITGYPGYVPGAPPSNPPAWNRACDYYRS
ncbi:MAG: HYR domain-containing protein, partial [Saprospiraceae bacterium]|nr:HYR domain-containing protein [Saprospiraceae bacterium]